ncbi:MAG: diphosphomevalonate decarboxylase [bacterium]|nr:MAG: diphosphomevalonate decarboxylase [bacterium]
MVTAKAHSNFALIKYWGKREEVLNLPAVGSISITLQEIFTISSLMFDKSLAQDMIEINGKAASPQEAQRVSSFIDLFRRLGKITAAVKVISRNNFPTGAGLASSASAFASLALAANQAANLNLTSSKLSELARMGSGSAARSIFGGFVEMKIGKRSDGSDSIAVPIAGKEFWDMHVLIAITSEKQKEIGSTVGMKMTAATSPYYPQWINTNQSDLKEMRHAIQNKDFEKLGELSELSCLKMHAVALSANPGLIYWNSATIDCMHAIRNLRKQNIPVYFTIDAGPQVKAICLKGDIPVIQAELKKIRGVKRIISSALGPDASILEDQL